MSDTPIYDYLVERQGVLPGDHPTPAPAQDDAPATDDDAEPAGEDTPEPATDPDEAEGSA